MQKNKELISQQEYSQWKQHPITREVVRELTRQRLHLCQTLETGGTVAVESVDTTALTTARCSGKIEGIDLILNLQFEDEEV